MNTTSPQCLFVVELEEEYGYRFWSGTMTEDRVSDYIEENRELGYGLSDIDHSGSTGCLGTCSDPL